MNGALSPQLLFQQALGLQRAGRLAGEPGALERLAAMADLADEPYSLTGF